MCNKIVQIERSHIACFPSVLINELPNLKLSDRQLYFKSSVLLVLWQKPLALPLCIEQSRVPWSAFLRPRLSDLWYGRYIY